MYAKVILGKNKIVHLCWKRGLMLAIGLNPSEIKELEIKEENIREGDPVSIDRLTRVKDDMKPRQTEGYDQLLIWALAGVKKEPELKDNIEQLNKIFTGSLNPKNVTFSR